MSKANILLIDDDEKLAKLLSAYFKKFDFSLESEVYPTQGLKKLTEKSFDLVILDVMLPEMNGFETCKAIRQNSNIPIIMLTARGDVNDRVKGLDIGADDYLSKPFDPSELIARIEVILKRINTVNEPITDNILSFKDLKINKNTYEVFVKEQKIELTTKEYALLILMSESPEKVYTRDDIMNELSGIDSELFSRSVDILVSRLRNKLKPLDYIRTAWGQGYKFSDTEME